MHDVGLIRAFLEPRHVALAGAARAFAASELGARPHAADDASARVEARALLGLLGRGGWIAHALPPAHGGAPDGPDARAVALVREALAAQSPLADAVYALQCLGGAPLWMSLQPAASAGAPNRPSPSPASPPDLDWLPRVASGDAMAAFALTEPDAGSDAGAMTTTARREADGTYVLDGRKHLISNAGLADFYVVFAKTDATAGTRGITAFVVPADAPGLRFVRAQVLAEPHPLGEIALDGCRVPADARLGGDGGGFKLAMRTLDRLRASVGAAACGMAARALGEARAHVLRRVQFGKPLAEQPLVRARLAELATELAAARLLVYRAAAEADAGGPALTVSAAMAKAYATEAAQRIVDGAVQLCGGAGVLVGHPVERLYRAVRALRIYEGTTEIQHLVIAAAMLKGGAEGGA